MGGYVAFPFIFRFLTPRHIREVLLLLLSAVGLGITYLVLVTKLNIARFKGAFFVPPNWLPVIGFGGQMHAHDNANPIAWMVKICKVQEPR